jgi:hypothetical protein
MRQGANGVSDAVSMRAKLSRPWKSPTTSRASASRSGVWPLLALGVVPLVAAVALTTAVPTGPATAAVTGTKRLIVLRVHFNDYTATSHYTKAQVDGLFANLDQLYKNMSYGRMNLSYQVSDLYKLPSNRSAYIDDFSDGDLSNGGKFDKVLNDAIANAPSGLNWSNIDGVMVLMAETNTSQFHRDDLSDLERAMDAFAKSRSNDPNRDAARSPRRRRPMIPGGLSWGGSDDNGPETMGLRLALRLTIFERQVQELASRVRLNSTLASHDQAWDNSRSYRLRE